MAMVVHANRQNPGIGGHISTYASAATLWEVAFNHFLHARTEDHRGDIVYFQGHASPGIYARAYLEGRLSKEQLERFRQECPRETGLSSYPHPWLMPDFWEKPTVSMGLAQSWAFIKPDFFATWNIAGSSTPRSRMSGVFSETARWTNRNRSPA